MNCLKTEESEKTFLLTRYENLSTIFLQVYTSDNKCSIPMIETYKRKTYIYYRKRVSNNVGIFVLQEV